MLEEGLKGGGGNRLVGMVFVLVLGMGDLPEFEFGWYIALGMGFCVGRRLVDRVLLFPYLISELLMFDTVDVEEGQPGILGISCSCLALGFSSSLSFSFFFYKCAED